MDIHAQGDDSAAEAALWGELLELTRRLARRLARQRTGGGEAEDLAMIVLEKFFTALERRSIELKYRLDDQSYTVITQAGSEVALPNYLAGIVKNTHYDRLKAGSVKSADGKYYRREQVMSERYNSASGKEPEVEDGETPETLVLAREEYLQHERMVRGLKQVIAALPDNERKIIDTYITLLLRREDANFKSYGFNQEVAQQLTISASQVGVVLSRVRHKLKTWLARQAKAGEDLPEIWQGLLAAITNKGGESNDK